jgi:hypothetical protein
VLNNLLDDLKKLDTCHGQERLELEATSRRDSVAAVDVPESGDGDILLEPKGGHAEQVTDTRYAGDSVTLENVITVLYMSIVISGVRKY